MYCTLKFLSQFMAWAHESVREIFFFFLILLIILTFPLVNYLLLDYIYTNFMSLCTIFGSGDIGVETTWAPWKIIRFQPGYKYSGSTVLAKREQNFTNISPCGLFLSSGVAVAVSWLVSSFGRVIVSGKSGTAILLWVPLGFSFGGGGVGWLFWLSSLPCPELDLAY